MTHFVKLALLLFTVILLSICGDEVMVQSSAVKTAFNPNKAITEITAQNKIFADALAEADSVTAASIYTLEARILSSGSTSTIGRAAVVSFYAEMIRAGITKFSYTTTGVSGNDQNLVVEDGNLSFAFSNGKIAAKGRYLLVWKRENGKLKIFRDTFFPDGK